MTPLGIGIVGTGNIAGGYAKDSLDAPRDPAGRGHGSRSRAHPGFAADLWLSGTRHARRPARRRRDRHRHQPDRPPRSLRGDQTRPRSGTPCLQREAAGPPLARGSRARGPRGRSRPSPRLLAVDVPRRGAADRGLGLRSGRLGAVRAIYAEVNWGRIETWHPAPAPFFDVGVLVDVGVYPLTLVTTMLGPARTCGHGAGSSCRSARPSTGRRSGSAARI